MGMGQKICVLYHKNDFFWQEAITRQKTETETWERQHKGKYKIRKYLLWMFKN